MKQALMHPLNSIIIIYESSFHTTAQAVSAHYVNENLSMFHPERRRQVSIDQYEQNTM